MTATRRWGRVAGTLAIGTGLWLGAISTATATLWEWTDGGGRVHKSRSLEDVPAEFQGGAVEIQEGTEPAPSAGPTVPPPRTETTAPARRPPPPAAPAASASGSEIGDDGGEPAADRDGHDRAWWQAQVIETRQQINDLEAKIEHLRSEGIRSPIVRKEREARKELSTAQDDLKKARAKLSTDLPEAAARAGAPPSWLVVK